MNRKYTRTAKSTACPLLYLIEAGIPKDRITTAGYGSTRPLAAGDTPKDCAKNRRVVIGVVE